MLGQDNLQFKQKCILVAAKFQQQLSSKKMETKEMEVKEQPKADNVYMPIQKVAVKTIQHYFPDLINIEYKDDLNKNIFYGTLTGSDKQDNIKKWKNF